MIVVDANVTAYLLLSGEKTPLAQQVLVRDSDWLTPPIWEHEFVNILATYGKKDPLAMDHLQGILAEVSSIVRAAKSPLDMQRVLALAVQRGLSAYDAEYVFLAQAGGLRLITEDAALIKAVPETAISMAAFIQSVTH